LSFTAHERQVSENGSIRRKQSSQFGSEIIGQKMASQKIQRLADHSANRSSLVGTQP
jgi:hypothetical protein